MKKNIVGISLGALAFFWVFLGNASAHEVHTYQIGNKVYEFVVGSLNEPVTVDDKTGVDFRVRLLEEHHDEEGEEDHHSTLGAVEGVDTTLKVEISAGDKKKTFDLSPVFGTPGSYKTTFYPTVQTTFSYRFLGTLNDAPVDLTFTCNPAGHPQTAEDKTAVKISDAVMRLSKRGAFGCPAAKADLGFPEPAASLNDLNSKASAVETRLNDLAPTTRNFTMLAIGLAVLGILLGAAAWHKKKNVI